MGLFIVTKTVQYTEKVQVEAASVEEAKARAQYMDGDRETDDIVVDITAIEIK